MKMLVQLDQVIDRILKMICLSLFTALFLLLTFNVFFRFIPIYSMGWFDEIVELSITSLSFYGAALLWKRREHSRIDFLVEKYKGTKKEYLIELIISIIGFIFMIFLTRYSIELMSKATAWSPIFKIPKKVFYSCMPISSIIMGIYAMKDIIVYMLLSFGKDVRLHISYNDY